MRYYEIVITDPNTGALWVPKGAENLNLGASFTSYVNGQTLPGAWQVELDIPVGPFGIPDADTGAGITVWGISLQDISQAQNLNGKSIAVYGGMQKGLPLASPTQKGLLAKGTIFFAFGNWIGVDQTMNMILTSPTGTNDQPFNIVHSWAKGQQLADAINQTLATAFPKAKITFAISSNLVASETETSRYPTLSAYANFIAQRSKAVLNQPNYNGVFISYQNDSILVMDGTQSPTTPAKALDFADLVGQPTWVGPNTVSIKTVMRGDISVSDIILPPPALTTQTAAAFPPISSQSAFKGNFQVTRIHHFGNYRAPNADCWVTTFEAIPYLGQVA